LNFHIRARSYYDMPIPKHWIKQEIDTKSPGVITLRIPKDIWARMHQSEYNGLVWSAVMRDALVAVMDLVDDDKSKNINK